MIFGIGGTSGCRFARVETWHACTYETFGVHSRFGGTSVAFVRLVELGVRSVAVVCRWVVVLCCSVVVGGRLVVGVVVLLFRFSGNSVAFVVP